MRKLRKGRILWLGFSLVGWISNNVLFAFGSFNDLKNQIVSPHQLSIKLGIGIFMTTAHPC
jgi:hypothetical protein